MVERTNARVHNLIDFKKTSHTTKKKKTRWKISFRISRIAIENKKSITTSNLIKYWNRVNQIIYHNTGIINFGSRMRIKLFKRKRNWNLLKHAKGNKLKKCSEAQLLKLDFQKKGICQLFLTSSKNYLPCSFVVQFVNNHRNSSVILQ